jgi:hypothetical protein
MLVFLFFKKKTEKYQNFYFARLFFGVFFFSFFLSDQKMDVRSMKAFKDGEFDSVLDKGIKF